MTPSERSDRRADEAPRSGEVAPLAVAPPLKEGDEAVVNLSIPCAPEYVGTARLMILGIASRMGFTYDHIEDIRLAVGEACTNAIDRAARASSTPVATLPPITITSHIEPSKLTIEVADRISRAASGGMNVETSADDIDGMNPQELGALLMEILVDEVNIETLPEGGTRVRLVKYTALEG